MELFSAEAESIRKMVGEWLTKSEYELETTFGVGGEVDSTTFLSVAQRLRAKQYAALPQEDRLVIQTPEHVRISLASYAVIQQYCMDDTLAGKPYTAMIKDRATADSRLDIEDYDVRFKMSRELLMAQEDARMREMLASWPQQRKAFRMIRRWTFEGDGMRIDMSIVRSTKRDSRGEFRWQKGFKDQDVLGMAPKYEIEVELLRKPADTAEDAMKRLIKGTGEILRGIQKHTLLIRKTQRAKVLAAYKELTGTEMFRGPAMRALLRKNFSKQRERDTPNIRDGYNVTDKADGLRALGFVDTRGELFLIDMGMNVYRTGLRQPELRQSLVDGEWVTKTADKKPIQQYLVFDIFYATDKRDVSQFPFQPGAVPPVQARASGPAGEEGPAAVAAPPPEDSRYNQMKAWVDTWNKAPGPKVIATGITAVNKLNVAAKEYKFGRAGDDSIFRQNAARVWTAARPYYTDGLIFTANWAPLPKEPAATFAYQFKWKPPRDNTIDFLVVMEKDKETKEDKVTTEVRPVTQETVSYKTLRLYVGSRTDNPRDVVLNKRKMPAADRTIAGRRGLDYKPVLFTPTEFPDPYASVCKMPVEVDPDTSETYVKTEAGEPIQDKTIVEMAYDPSEAPGWRWKPLRVRTDKTERFQRGVISRTLNAAQVANDVWETIYDPVTESMICSGAEEPSQAELDAFGEGAMIREMAARRYFDRKAPVVDQNITKPMVKFHNRWIKEKILYPAGLSGEGKALLDLACGQGNDLHMWRRIGVDFVLGVDYAAQNITDPRDGAWARYMNVAAEAGGVERVEPMVFAIANVTKPLVNPPAGNATAGTDEDKDILRFLFGRQRPVGSVPRFVAEDVGARLKMGADCVSCMFAIHYFFEAPDKLEGLLRNIADTLKVGGYFIGCCFDGDTVFQALREKAKGESIAGSERDQLVWKITKQYEAEDLLEVDGGFGVAVDVEFATIGMGHREYLVPFKVLEEKLALVGCELLTKEELAPLGLVNSTAMFETSWDMAKRRGQEFKMPAATREFSFFNRWFIFKRKRQAALAEAALAEARAIAAANGQPTGEPAPQPNALPTAGRAATARANAARTAAAATAIQQAQLGEKVANAVANMGTLATGLPAAANAVAAVPPPLTAALASGAAPAGAAGRTIPVAAGPAAAPAATRTYEPGEVFIFYTDAAVRDSLGIKDKGAGRWLAPSAPFAINDPDDDTITYPTMEHFLGGMRVKLASNKPEMAPKIFGREGTIHQKILNDKTIESGAGTRPLTEERDHEYTKMEMAAVKDAMRPPPLKKLGVIVDEAKWATAKEAMLTEALTQRWTKDARFRKAVEAARSKGKYLLFYTPGSSTNVGGVRRESGRIDGENKIGKIMMKLAGYPE